MQIGIFSPGFAETNDLDKNAVNERLHGLVTLAQHAEEAGFDLLARGISLQGAPPR